MSEMMMMQELKFAKGLDPVADAFDNAAAPASDVYSMRDYGRILFVVYIGVGVTGTQTLTVEACDDVVPTNVATMAFWSREILTGDTDGAITRRAAAGFTVTAGSSKIILVEAEAKDLPAGKPFIRLKQSAEPTNSPCLGGIMAILGGRPTRYSKDVNATVIV
jgi:hypothetical protein